MVTGRKVEVEMKYQLRSPDSADRYLVAPELGPFRPTGQVRIVQIEDRYVDSADWASPERASPQVPPDRRRNRDRPQAPGHA